MESSTNHWRLVLELTSTCSNAISENCNKCLRKAEKKVLCQISGGSLIINVALFCPFQQQTPILMHLLPLPGG